MRLFRGHHRWRQGRLQHRSDGIESIALYAYIDGVIQKLLGARGNVSFDFSAGQLPTAKFKFLAKYAAGRRRLPVLAHLHRLESAACLQQGQHRAEPVWRQPQRPIVVDRHRQHRQLPQPVQPEDIVISDRAVTGSTRFEMTTVATKDWFGLATDVP